MLDTNLVSETRKARADAGVLAFLTATDPALLYVSVLTLGELRRGVQAKRLADAAAADALGAWVDGIETMFSDRVLAVDTAVARRSGELSAGRSLPVIDTLIAATALRHGLTLVTRNIADVSGTGAALLNPWRGAAVQPDC